MHRLQTDVLFSKIDRFKPEKFFAVLLLAAATLAITTANATSVDLNSIVLSLQGNIEGQKNEPIELDIASLVELEATVITTKQPWTKKPAQYTGVRVNTLLESIGALSNQFEAMAGNDYKYTLSDIDFDKYPIIIAYKIDGEFVDARQLGPLLIVFPFDDYPELLNERNKAASVWQLTKMLIL